MARARTGDQALVREINLTVVLRALRERSPISRASLASLTGLNKATVSSLVEELIGAGLVIESGFPKAARVGRPGVLLELNPAAGCIFGVEIGVGFVSVIATDFAASVLWRGEENTRACRSQEVVIPRAIGMVREALARVSGSFPRVLGAGVGVAGLVDVSSGRVLFAPNLGWQDVPLREAFEAELDFPIYVDNEANMAALGETCFGVARGARSVLYVSAGVGLGGGIVLDGQLMSGAAGVTGEMGHMTMLPDGARCNCGNRGCWETLVSQNAVLRRVRELVSSGAGSLVADLARGEMEDLTIPQVVEAARAGDEVCRRALRETAEWLGIGIANLVNLLNPEVVVLGGILSLAGEFVMPVVERVVTERALRWPAESAKLLVAGYGPDAAVMGGVATVYERVLSNPGASLRARRASPPSHPPGRR